MKKRYHPDSGTRLTDCCGARSTAPHGWPPTCRACKRDVPYGQGDGGEGRVPEGATEIDRWCTDPECCDPPGYHDHDIPDCPACGAKECAVPAEIKPPDYLYWRDTKPKGGWPEHPDKSLTQCYACNHQWSPPPLTERS